MKRLIKVTILIAVVVIILKIIYSVCAGLYIGGIFSKHFDYDEMKKYFNDNTESFLTINEYIINSGCDEVCIYPKRSGKYLFLDGEKEQISNKRVLNAIRKIRKSGFNTIKKENGVICYQQWSDTDSGSGVVYSPDGGFPKLNFVTKVIGIYENDWYYYEEDYNEWETNIQKLLEGLEGDWVIDEFISISNQEHIGATLGQPNDNAIGEKINIKQGTIHYDGARFHISDLFTVTPQQLAKEFDMDVAETKSVFSDSYTANCTYKVAELATENGLRKRKIVISENNEIFLWSGEAYKNLGFYKLSRQGTQGDSSV